MKRRKGFVDSEAGAVLFIGVFFGMLIFLSTLGANTFSSTTDVQNPQDNPDCKNTSTGFECSSSFADQIGNYIGASSDIPFINYIVYTPLGLLVGWIIIKILPLT